MTVSAKFGAFDRWLERYRNVIIYILMVGFGDLLQLWLYFVTYRDDAHPMALDDMVMDGSLFFFSATLFCAGIWHLMTSPKRSGRTIMLFLTLFVVAPSTFLLIQWYGRETHGLIEIEAAMHHLVVGEGADCSNIKPSDTLIAPGVYMTRQVIIAFLAAFLAIAIVVWTECGHRPEDNAQPVKIRETV